MCGIAGILSKKQVVKNTIKQMTDTLIHRGPDAEGFFVDNNIGLGHRRLSIIDLSGNASQPMFFNDLAIIFNGEIYNYKELKTELEKESYTFITQSDTEVLLKGFHCYGEAVLQKLDGMFSFAIWDKTKKELFCARDRFGEKPFYYYFDGQKFVFASEMKAIFESGIQKQLNNNMLFQYLAFDMVENPENKKETFFKDIYKLEASTFLKIHLSEFKIKKQKYWKLNLVVNKGVTGEQAAEKFKYLLNESVSRRLRSDVNVGTSLSGGLDSSTLVALINNQLKGQGEQKTFSARFQNKKFDEGKYIEIMHKKFNTDHHNVFVAADSLEKNFDKIMYHQEEPFGSASILAQWNVMQLAKANNTTVLLDGQGADEILAGYHGYFIPFLKELYLTDKQIFIKEKQLLAEKHNFNIKTDLKFRIGIHYQKTKSLLRKNYHKFNKPAELKLLNKDFVQAYFTQVPFYESRNLNDSLMYDTNIYGLEKLLRYADRNAMAHSVETRLPFLYHKLVEFLFSLPAEMKIKNAWTKYILRISMQDILPKEIVWRVDKMGYQAPQNEWMQSGEIPEILKHYKNSLISEKYINDNFNDNWKVFMIGKFLNI